MRLKNHQPYLHHLIQLDVQNLVELGLTHTIPENDDVVWFPLLGAGVKVHQELPEKKHKIPDYIAAMSRATNTSQQSKKLTDLNIPSSTIFSSWPGTSLKRLSIISTLRDCVRTHALYFEMSGHCLELTTYCFQTNKHQVTREIEECTMDDII